MATWVEPPSIRVLRSPLRVGAVDDPAEVEAEALAEHVMRMPDPASTLIQRCPGGCPDEEVTRRQPIGEQEEELQRQSVEDEEELQLSAAGPDPPGVESSTASTIGARRGGGAPLPGSSRRFFEPRFGADLSGVRVHHDGEAADLARSVNARAFTVGRDVFFGSGEWAPGTDRGDRLVAHELAHTVQRGARLSRMAVGSGPPPNGGWAAFGLASVPPDETARVQGAIDDIAAVSSDPAKFADCHKYFSDNCPGGGPASLASAFRNATVWKMTTPSGTELARGDAPGTTIAYTAAGYSDGRQGLVETLVHELMHNCGISGAKGEHHRADVAGLYCIGNRNEIGLEVGSTLSESELVWLFTYRRVLGEWAGGKFQIVGGADINYTGSLFELVGLDATKRSDRPRELGAAPFGVRGRSALLWGGNRFGGLTGSVEAGPSLGRFRLRTVDSTALGFGVTVRVGVGAEFYLPIGMHAFPLTVEAAWRMAQPLNGDAERIHAITGGVSVPF